MFNRRRVIFFFVFFIGSILITAFQTVDSAVQFADNRPLTLTWEQVGQGPEILVCNGGITPLTAVRVEPLGFGFELAETAVPAASVLSFSSVSSLESGACASVEMVISIDDTPDAGSYTGLLLASAPGGGVDRRELTITIPAETKIDPVGGVVEEVALTAVRNGPGGSVQLTDSYLPLKPTAGVAEAVLDAGSLAGVVLNQGERGQLYIDGDVDLTAPGAALVPLRWSGGTAVGEYSGTLDVTGKGEKDEAIAVSVTVTDRIWPVLAAMIFGLGIAFLAQMWKDRWRYASKLKTIRDGLISEYTEGKQNFAAHFSAEPFKDYNVPAKEDMSAYLGKFDAQLEKYKQEKWTFDVTSDDFKKLFEILETVKEDAHHFGDPEGFGKALQKLNQELTGFFSFFPGYINRRPLLIDEALKLIVGRPLKVGEARTISKKAAEFTQLIQEWRKMADKVKLYMCWANLLGQKYSVMTPRDQERWHRARAKLVEVINEMADAKDAAALKEMEAAVDLQNAYGRLAYLGSRYDCWKPTEQECRQEEAGREEGFLELSRWGVFMRRPGIDWQFPGLHSLLAGLESAGGQNLFIPRIRKAGTRVGDILVLLLAFAVTVLTGITQLYIGKTFGTCGDYLAVIFLGTATQTVFKTFTDLLGTLRQPMRGIAEDEQEKV